MILQMIRNTTLCQQILLTCFRPLLYIICISNIKYHEWAIGYLLVIGCGSLYAIADSAFQAVERYSFVSSKKSGFSISARLYFFVLVFLICINFLGVYNEYGIFLSVSFISLNLLASSTYLFERKFATTNAIKSQLAIELYSYILLTSLFFITKSFYAIAFLVCMLPISRIITAILYIEYSAPVFNPMTSGHTRFKFIASSICSQIASSLAGSAPSFALYALSSNIDLVASMLLTFKVLFVSSAIFSTYVNFYASRIFYGSVNFIFNNHKLDSGYYDRAFIQFFIVAFILTIICLALDFFKLYITLIALIISFSYLNLISSVSLAQAKPYLSFISQLILLLGTIAFSIIYIGYQSTGIFLLSLFAILMIIFLYKVPLSALKPGFKI